MAYGALIGQKTDLSGYLPLTGGTISGNLTVTGNITGGGTSGSQQYIYAGNLARIYTSLTDGGAVRLLSPSSYNQEWTLDAYNGDFRIYNRDADTQTGYLAPITIDADSGEVSVSTDLTAGGQTFMRYRGNWNSDFNSTALECGVYWVHITDSTANAPSTSANYGWLICYGPQSVQQFVEYDYHRVYTRGYTNSQWYPWVCTGGASSVTARGTSGSWTYTQWSDGWRECSAKLLVPYANGTFCQASYTLPFSCNMVNAIATANDPLTFANESSGIKAQVSIINNTTIRVIVPNTTGTWSVGHQQGVSVYIAGWQQ